MNIKTIRQLIQILKFGKGNNLGKNIKISLSASVRSTTLEDYSRIADWASIRNSVIGDYSTIGRYSKISHTHLGKFCSISWNTSINAIHHNYNALTIHAFPYVPYAGRFVDERKQNYEDVAIGNDVWIGANAVVMPGVTIGNGSVIGAGSIVTKDVDNYSIVAGAPAKHLKYRFTPDVCILLEQLRWWNWDRKRLFENIHLFQGDLTEERINMLERIMSDSPSL